MKTHWFLLSLLLFLPGCFVQSLNPFHTDNLVIELPQILGEWNCLVQQGEAVLEPVSPWIFTDAYIETYDSDNKYSELDMTYFRIGDRIYMDFMSGDPSRNGETGNMFWCAGVMLTHSLASVELAGDKLVLIPLKLEWLESMLQSGAVKLEHVSAGTDNTLSGYLFLAEPEHWVSFLEKYGSDPKAFDPAGRFEFERAVSKVHKRGVKS